MSELVDLLVFMDLLLQTAEKLPKTVAIPPYISSLKPSKKETTFLIMLTADLIFMVALYCIAFVYL